MAVATIELSQTGRLVPSNPDLEDFGGDDVVFAGGRLVATAFDVRKHRVIVFVFGIDGERRWREELQLEVPLDCTPLDTAVWTSRKLALWGTDRVMMRIEYDASRGHGHSLRSFVGELDLAAGVLSPAAFADGDPVCRGGEVSVLASKDAVSLQRDGGPPIAVADPDADPLSRFGQTAIVGDARAIWVAATGTYNSPFEPRLHELDPATGRVRRTVRFGANARPGLGFSAALWDGGVLVSSGWHGEAAFVAPDGTATLLSERTWVMKRHGDISGQTSVAVGEGFAAIGAPFGASGAGCVTLFDRPGHPIAVLKLEDAHKTDRLGVVLAASERWLAIPFSRARTPGSIQLVRIEGARVKPARVHRERPARA